MDFLPDNPEEGQNSTYLDENAERFTPEQGGLLPLSGLDLLEQLRIRGSELGLVRVGATPAEPFVEARAAFERWLGKSYAGTMQYLSELGDRCDPRRLLPNARTVVVVAMPTAGAIEGPVPNGCGEIADYALGLDYHIALRGRIKRLCQAMADYAGRPVWARPCVDTAPLLEREAARRAGIGFIAKSTMLIVPGLGPRLMLGAVVTDLELPAGEPMETRCGRCTLCLDACPTRAFAGPFELDARKCISYLTIEHQGEISSELRKNIGVRLVGCDVCQSVCPYDRIQSSHVMPTDNAPRSLLVHPNLKRWLQMSSTEYRRITKRTALRRLGRVQLMRNAAVAMGNSRDRAHLASLLHAVHRDKSEIVRAHAAWAIGEIASDGEWVEAANALSEALDAQESPWVREELRIALTRLRA